MLVARTRQHVALLLGAAGLAGCTPPWYWFSTIAVDGQLLPAGRCTADVRGDVTRHVVLAASAMRIDNNVGVICGGASREAWDVSRDMSTFQFILPARATGRGVATGVYRVVADRVWTARSAADPAITFFTATMYLHPADATHSRSYDAVDGRLTVTGTVPAPDGSVHVVGTFHVRARRSLRFD